MQFDDDRLPYEKPVLLCLTSGFGIIKGFSGNEETNGDDVEQPTQEPIANPDPFA